MADDIKTKRIIEYSAENIIEDDDVFFVDNPNSGSHKLTGAAIKSILEPIPDKTLTVEGKSADAKEVGDRIKRIESSSDAKYIGSAYNYEKITASGSAGILKADNTVLSGTGHKASTTVVEGEIYKISGRQFDSVSAPAYLLRKNGSVAYVGWIEIGYFDDYIVSIPSEVDELIVNLNSSLGLSGAIKKANKITTENLVDLLNESITTDRMGNTITVSWISGGWINRVTGIVVQSETFSYTDYLPVNEGEKIRVTNAFGGNSGPAFYDQNKVYIEYSYESDYTLKEHVLQVPHGAKYVRLTTSNASTSDPATETMFYENIYRVVDDNSKKIDNVLAYIGHGRFDNIDYERKIGFVNSQGDIGANEAYRITSIVNPGDILLITGYQVSDWYPLGAYMNNGTIVKPINAGKTGDIDRLFSIVPENVNKIIVNGDEASIQRLTGHNIVRSEYDWIVPQTSVSSGVIATDGTTVATGNHMTVKVQAGDHCRISGKKWNDYVPSYLISDGVSIISSGQSTDEYFTNLEIVIPENGRILYVNGNSQVGLKCYKYSSIGYQNKTKQLRGKTMVWFGTSIPYNSVYFDGENWSIPTYSGKILGMNVINECYGASIAARGVYDVISNSDPYGWTGISWYAVFRSLGASLEEKQDLIDNYSSKWYNLLGGSTDPLYANAKPQTLTDELKSEILSCSYENKLIPYLNGTKTMPDLFVFEHGYNDSQATTFSGISPNENNLNMSLYSDAMYFFFKKIFEANPQAKILIVSHYDNSSVTGKKTFNAQKELAEYHGVYFCDVANNVGWTQRRITTTGYWNNGLWIPDGGSERTITRLQQCIPDQVHPHTDKSGKAVKREAQIIADYISSSINLD